MRKKAEILRDKLREKKGTGITDSLVTLIVIAVAVAVVLAALPVLSKAYYLHSYIDDVARYVELTGTTDGIDATLDDLNGRYFGDGTVPSVDLVSGMTFIAGTRNIQLGDRFTVSAAYVYQFEVSDLISVPITINARSVGRSEVYFKTEG